VDDWRFGLAGYVLFAGGEEDLQANIIIITAPTPRKPSTKPAAKQNPTNQETPIHQPSRYKCAASARHDRLPALCNRASAPRGLAPALACSPVSEIVPRSRPALVTCRPGGQVVVARSALGAQRTVVFAHCNLSCTVLAVKPAAVVLHRLQVPMNAAEGETTRNLLIRSCS